MKKVFHLTLVLLVLGFGHLELTGQRRPLLLSPEVHQDNSVTFRYDGPDAKSVELSAEFLKEFMALTKIDTAVWSITVDPVDPDIYPYYFIVDGIRVSDPSNTFLFPNEGFQRSIVDIPGDSPLIHAMQDVPHGKLSYRYYKSESLGTRSVIIYTPPGYEKDTDTSYPILYLLHGTTDTEETWSKVGRANLIMDNLISQDKAKPMIIVMPYGRAYPVIPRRMGSIRNWDNLQEFSNDFLNNIMPFVENNYRVIKEKESRAITGFSGGGGQSLYIGLSNPDIFASVGGFAPGMRTEEFDRNNAVAFADPDLTNERLKLFWIGCGSEDGLYGVVQEYLKVLDEKKINHETFITTGGHTWMNCRLFLTEFTKLLFQ